MFTLLGLAVGDKDGGDEEIDQNDTEEDSEGDEVEVAHWGSTPSK